MNTKEPIEQWRKEFEGLTRGYRPSARATSWWGFLLAKRNMKVIELPEPEDMYDQGGYWLGRFFADGYIHNAITEAGYQYEVKE